MVVGAAVAPISARSRGSFGSPPVPLPPSGRLAVASISVPDTGDTQRGYAFSPAGVPETCQPACGTAPAGGDAVAGARDAGRTNSHQAAAAGNTSVQPRSRPTWGVEAVVGGPVRPPARPASPAPAPPRRGRPARAATPVGGRRTRSTARRTAPPGTRAGSPKRPARPRSGGRRARPVPAVPRRPRPPGRRGSGPRRTRPRRRRPPPGPPAARRPSPRPPPWRPAGRRPGSARRRGSRRRTTRRPRPGRPAPAGARRRGRRRPGEWRAAPRPAATGRERRGEHPGDVQRDQRREDALLVGHDEAAVVGPDDRARHGDGGARRGQDAAAGDRDPARDDVDRGADAPICQECNGGALRRGLFAGN